MYTGIEEEKIMGRTYFTKHQMKNLLKNPYVDKVNPTMITYSDEFKRIFIAEDSNGKPPRVIFKECGFDIDLLGSSRIRKAAYRWRKAYRERGLDGLIDRRGQFKESQKGLSLQEQNDRLQAEIHLLKAENELLKKLDMIERGMKITE